LTEAIVLAGGFGSRLKSVVSNVPKPMAPINGRPFLDILLASLSDRGVTTVVLSVGYLAGEIQNYFGDQKHGINILYHVEAEPLGTGGAICASLQLCETENIFVLNGDTFVDVDFDLLQAFWKEHGNPIMVTREVSSASRYGAIVVEDHLIKSFSPFGNNPDIALINAGVYMLPKNILKDYSVGDSFSFEHDFLPKAIISTRFFSFKCEGYFIDIGVPEDFEKAQYELCGK
jgi:D-glycero-alpha-D-manno-heptose 1-phosphate guanylyltransferase